MEKLIIYSYWFLLVPISFISDQGSSQLHITFGVACSSFVFNISSIFPLENIPIKSYLLCPVERSGPTDKRNISPLLKTYKKLKTFMFHSLFNVSTFDMIAHYSAVQLFFICSGYLYQKNSVVNSISSWKENIVRKLIVIGIPYFVFSLFSNLETRTRLLYSSPRGP